MPVTILQCVIARLHLKTGEGITGGDCERAGFAILGGCQMCNATIAAHNACPTKSGFWSCLNECVGDRGFESVKEALEFIFPAQRTKKQAFKVFCSNPEFEFVHRKYHIANKVAREFAYSKAETSVFIEHRSGKIVGRYSPMTEKDYYDDYIEDT